MAPPAPMHLLLLVCALAALALPALALGDGAIVAVLDDGTEMRERITLKGQSYRWVRSVDFSSRTADSEDLDEDDSPDPDNIEQRAAEEAEYLFELLEKSDEELALLFSTVALFGSQEYREEIPEDQVAARGQQARDDLFRELHVKEGIAEPKANSTEPRTSARNTGLSPNITVEEENEQGTWWEFLQTGNLNKGGQNRKLLGGGGGGGGSSEENEEEAYASICQDGRSLMNNLNWPHTAQVALGYSSSYSSNAMYSHSCSATLVSDSTALSAAHCFWDLEEDKWFPTYSWAPGYDSEDSDPSPYGMWKSCYYVTIKSIYQSQTKNTWGAFKYDFAVMNFDMCNGPVRNGVNPSIPGNGLSLQGYWPNVPSSALGTLYNRGYPGSWQTCGSNAATCNSRVWGQSGSYGTMDTDYVTSTSYTSSGGHSGSGTYVYWSQNQKPYVACVHIAGKTCSGKTFSKKTTCKRITDLFDELIKNTSVDY